MPSSGMISKEGEEQLEAIVKPLAERLAEYWDYAEGFGEAMAKWEEGNGYPDQMETLEVMQRLFMRFTPPKHKDKIPSMVAGMIAGMAASKSRERLR